MNLSTKVEFYQAPKRSGKIEANNRRMNELRLEGRQHCFKGELPYPEAVSRSLKGGPVLVVTGVAIIFKTLEPLERVRLEKGALS